MNAANPKSTENVVDGFNFMSAPFDSVIACVKRDGRSRLVTITRCSCIRWTFADFQSARLDVCGLHFRDQILCLSLQLALAGAPVAPKNAISSVCNFQNECPKTSRCVERMHYDVQQMKID